MSTAAAEGDQALATRLAVEAGELLVRTRADLFAQGLNHWSVKDAGDDAAQSFLMNELRALRPDDAVLSEEGREDPRRVPRHQVKAGRLRGGRSWPATHSPHQPSGTDWVRAAESEEQAIPALGSSRKAYGLFPACSWIAFRAATFAGPSAHLGTPLHLPAVA